MGSSPPNEILTLKELAAYLKVNERTLYRLLADGKLVGLRIGHAWRFRRAEVDEWTRSVRGFGQGEDGRG